MSCPSRRIRYRSLRQANRAISLVVKTMSGEQVPSRAYLCPHCNGWHLSHVGKKVKT